MTKFNATLAAVALFGAVSAANAGLAQFANSAVLPAQAVSTNTAVVATPQQPLVPFAHSAVHPGQSFSANDAKASTQTQALVQYSQSAVVPSL
ncbi:hypothetical protein SAMN02745857_02231 [Andreprevotia lacus DSM 23236]|uniref:Uncharacterized protein n=1 Tax=Andreprevotia lacus DSM 23236 TaxID=1121001 RepID=A0A1W1XQ75_9NEIS|nr:hypothetical protein [Andreprevotia lacus]SMC25668.1 hypothetical protein SAMN02745857_02231 [Andreprevotia lacus DSM 23236]